MYIAIYFIIKRQNSGSFLHDCRKKDIKNRFFGRSGSHYPGLETDHGRPRHYKGKVLPRCEIQTLKGKKQCGKQTY